MRHVSRTVSQRTGALPGNQSPLINATLCHKGRKQTYNLYKITPSNFADNKIVMKKQDSVNLSVAVVRIIDTCCDAF